MTDTISAEDKLSKNEALAWVVEHSPLTVGSYTELAGHFGWERTKTWRVVQGWKRLGYVTTETTPNDGKMHIAIVPTAIPLHMGDDDVNDSARGVSGVTDGHSGPPVAASVAAPAPPATDTVYATYIPRPRAGAAEPMAGLDILVLLAALSLAGVAAWFSIHGMVTLFPGNPAASLWLGISLEGAKIITAAWLGARWADVGWLARVSLIGFTTATGVLNATGVYSQLVAAHIGPKGMTAAGLETQDAGAAAKIEAAQGRVADIDRRLALIDATVEGAARRGNARMAANAMTQQRQARAGLAQERERAMAEVASLKTDRAGGAAQGRAAALEAEPIRYVAEFLGVQRGGEEVIRWVIALIVGCTDPFAIALAAALAARRRRTA